MKALEDSDRAVAGRMAAASLAKGSRHSRMKAEREVSHSLHLGQEFIKKVFVGFP
ncbi:MAG TPA: hypothetical protein VN259_01825 [Xanthomonadales bacterium]|nr:hypothetical protein [Xanthomonadales bacterium]